MTVFFEWKYHISGFVGRETHETTGWVGFPGQENHECDISTQKTHKCRLTLKRAFWGIFSSNRRKFTSEIQDPRRHDDITPTGALTSLGHVVRRSTICMTSLRVNNVFTTMHRLYHMASHVIQLCDTEKYHTVGLHAWQWQKFGSDVRIKLFSRVWNLFQWC
jgi:hypothetical protein